MLNSAATIFTVDIYQRHVRKGTAGPRDLVRIGRIATGLLVIIGCLWAPLVAKAGSVYQYIQMFWGFISPGIVASFLFGLFWKKTPPMAASGAMLLGIPVYGLLLWSLPQVAFLHHMMITFVVLCLFITALTLARPLTVAPSMPPAPPIDLTPSRGAKIGGVLVVVATAALYVVFW
jgi:SSS family solute:Na+ symporter